MTSSLTFPDSQQQGGGFDRRKILTGAAALAASAATMKTASAASVAPLGQTGAPTTASPPLPLGRLGETLGGAFDRLGWHWWPSDAAIISAPYGEGRQPCNLCGPCDLGCPRGARASSDITYWPEAIAAGADLRTRCRVSTVTVDARGRATGVAYFDADGVELHQAGDVVVMAANGGGTARLLVRRESLADLNARDVGE